MLKKQLNSSTKDLMEDGNQEYQIERSLSYSRLSDFARNGPDALINRHSGQSMAMSVGTLTDWFLNEHVNVLDEFIVYDGSKPTASLGKLCNIIIDNYSEVPDKEEVFRVVNEVGFWSNIKDEEKLYNKFDNSEFWDYIRIMIEGREKEIVTSDIYLKAEELALLIKTHKYTKHYFSDDYQRVYQYFFEININNCMFKGEIDYIAIDRKNKTVQIIDFKTGGDSAKDFPKSFLSYRYFIQSAVYMHTLDHISKTFNLEGYTLLPFKFIYISRSEMIPVSYTVTEKWHEASLKGFTTTTGYTYRGLYDLIDDVIWHFNNRVFDMPRYIYEDKGNLSLDDNLILLADE